MPEKPHNFWQELKRRKVFRVIAMYAAAAYVIIELSNNIVEPLNLPDWTPTMIIVLLIIGFPFAVIFSWIFDVTPKGIQKTKPAKVNREKEAVSKPAQRKLKVSDIIIAVLLIAVIILVYPKIFKRDNLEQLRSKGKISIAVMPFQNMTNDTTWNVWQEGIQNELITSLTNSEELKVRQTETINNLLQGKDLVNYASITPSIASNISQKLEANIFIYGTIKQAGGTIRVNAQLVDSKTEEIFKSFEINGQAREEMIFQVIDSLKREVRDFLIINKLVSELPVEFRNYSVSNNPGAYRYFIYGNQAFHERNYPTARNWYQQALEADSNFTAAEGWIAISYGNQGLYEEAKKWCLRIYRKRDLMPIRLKIMTDWLYANYFETTEEEIKHIKQALKIDEQSPMYQYILGYCYNKLDQYDKAIPEFEKTIELYDKVGVKPPWIYSYTELGIAYHETGEYRREKKLYKRAEKDFPGDPLLLNRQTILALSTGKTRAADEYIEKYISALKENSASDADIASDLGSVYWDAGLFDEAEEYYHQALSLEPENPLIINDFAYLLIDNDLNIKEGLELIEKALELSPDNYLYLDTKGWGLYKQGKYQEAHDILQKSWDLRMGNAIYNHEAFLHLEAAKKAVADQKSE